MTGAFRTDTAGRIDRAQKIRFTFDGRALTGCGGDTLASALLANGVHLVGRSFKYHRPRGIVAAGSEEPNALVRVGAAESRCTPNLRATGVELYDGLVAESQNRFPSLAFDLGALNDFVAPLLPAGFYYKTFMWPAWGWHLLYEPAVRAMAGLGRAPTAPDADNYAQLYAHCDVLVVGAGPAGLAAALAAADGGARVLLCDEHFEIGGSLLDSNETTPRGQADLDWRAQVVSALSQDPRVTMLARTTAFGMFAQNFVALCERVTDHLAAPDPALPRERLWQVRAKQIVLATGAIERPLVFPGNDRPGIMLAGAARTYLHRYGVRAGTRAVIATSDDGAYEVALDLAQAGVTIAAIADTRQKVPDALASAARDAGIDVRPGTVVANTAGRLRVRSATLASLTAKTQTKLECDLLLMSGGHTPSVHLFAQARGALRFAPDIGAFVPSGDGGPVQAAGACRGIFATEAAIADGHEAGTIAAMRAVRPTAVAPSRTPEPTPSETPPPTDPAPTNGRAFVDFQNDVTSKDVELAVREGFVSVEHVKRYTTTGMATDQGKTSNINALGLVAQARGTDLPHVGLTTFRMPYTPVTFGTLAGPARGALFDPVRQTPLHDWAVQKDAVFEDVGLWKRARYFPAAGETMAQAVARECRAVRQAAGIFDASTLGKIEVTGPDAALFLERMYVNGFRKLAPGRARYGLLLREDGFVYDDGVIGRVAPDKFHVTTTTGGAPRVLAMMEDYLQTEWPDLRVWLTSTTEEWAVIAVQGPHSREIIAPLIENIDFSPQTLPHMGVATGNIGGIPLRLFRVSFSGELGYELNVPADYAQTVFDAIWQRGAPLGLVPYGTETMHVLRAEKGYIIVGQETDGTVTPDDVGLGWAVNTAKADFVGKRSLARAAMADPSRKQLVGLLTENPRTVLEEGAQIVVDPSSRKSLGHVTSSYASATFDRSIALSMVAGGRARTGATLHVPMLERTVSVRVVSPVFYDPAGERLHG
ncbi:MAG: sarcosine oxidase subunit alpha family protein [Rhodospirillales bacterium]